jgi:class 3 adenylate cyclase
MNPHSEVPSSTTSSNGRALETAVLFVDLVSSTDFASVLGLREYARYVDCFEATCQAQCRYFFETYHAGAFRSGLDYDFHFLGDELTVFLHSGNAADDVYQLICLAITLKCGWLGAPPNTRRLSAGFPTAELAAGVHVGNVWASRRGGAYVLRGSAINVAKRVETASRDGDHFRIYVSDPAYKRIGRKIRNLLFSPRRVLAMKGIVLPAAVREVSDSFMDVSERLAPQLASPFHRAAPAALNSATFDLWIHSCLQVWEQNTNKRVTDDCLELCRFVLGLEPGNACALYHAAQGERERGNPDTARLYLEDLTRQAPQFADGWLELGRLLKQTGEHDAAHRAILQARRRGVRLEEEDLPVR